MNYRHLPPGVTYNEVTRIGKIDAGSIQPVLNYIIPRMNEPMPKMDGFGIVTAAGGKYLRYLWALAKKTRALSDAPIQCYHLGPQEINHPSVPLLRELGVEFVDAIPLMVRENYQSRHGWCVKSIALKHSPFRYACFMDADCIPLIDPESLLTHDDFRTGFLAWNDIQKCRKTNMIFPLMGLRMPKDFVEFEAGQQVWDKKRHWKELQLFSWMNGRPHPFHDLLHGDKDLAPLSFMKLGTPFNVGGAPQWMGHGIKHSLTDGTEAFLHHMPDKRGGPVAPEVADLLREFDSITLQKAA